MRLRAVRTAVNRAVVAVVCAASSALAGWSILLTAWEPEMEIPVLETGPAADASRPGASMDELSEAIRMLREQDFGVVLRFRNQAGNHRH